MEKQIKAWYECEYCDEVHHLSIRYNNNLPSKIDIVKEVIEEAISAFQYELHERHDLDKDVELDMDRLFFCEV